MVILTTSVVKKELGAGFGAVAALFTGVGAEMTLDNIFDVRPSPDHCIHEAPDPDVDSGVAGPPAESLIHPDMANNEGGSGRGRITVQLGAGRAHNLLEIWLGRRETRIISIFFSY